MKFHLYNPKTGLPECARSWWKRLWFRWFGFASAPYTASCVACRNAVRFKHFKEFS